MPPSKRLFLRLLGSSILAFAACKRPHDGNNNVQVFEENGVPWGFGVIEVGPLDAPGTVMVENLTPNASLASDQDQLHMFRALQAPSATAEKPSLLYADYAPNTSQLVAFVYDLQYVLRVGTSETVDIYAVLHQDSPSAANQRRVMLGTANFGNQTNLAEVDLVNGLHLSRVVSGLKPGQWVLHFADARPPLTSTQQGINLCGVSQLPGVMPNQTVSQWTSDCKLAPPADDICDGSPLRDGCRPPIPTVGNGPNRQYQVAVENTDALGSRVYRFIQHEDPALLTFTARNIAATDAQNAQDCAKKFYAMARTLNDRGNPSCSLIRAPSPSASNGKLSCRIALKFNQPLSYLEKICNVVGVFKDEDQLPQVAQILTP